MISFTEYLIFGNAVTCSVLAVVILTKQDVWVQRARTFVYVTASASFVCGGLGWLAARPWAIEALGRGTLLAVAVGCGIGVLWLLRSRLRPRGFHATTRRYAARKQAKYVVEELPSGTPRLNVEGLYGQANT